MAALTIKPCTLADVPAVTAVATHSYLEVYPYGWHDGGEWYPKLDSTSFRAFYEKLGFVLCGAYRLDFELLKDELRGMVVMMKWLNQQPST